MIAFTNPVKLGFDPNDIGGKVADVFEDGIARTFWLAIRPTHLTGEELHDQCLSAATLLRKEPITLESVQRTWSRVFGPTYEATIPERILPYLQGEQFLAYEIVR